MADRARDRAAALSHAGALAGARAEYIRLGRHVRKHGFDADAIGHTVESLSQHRDGCWWLDPVAYRPTGIVLGCPLPRSTTARLSRLLSVLNAAHGGDAFTCVPPAAFHITLVNRSHFDETTPATLDPEEHRAAAAVISALQIGTIELMCSGLSITSRGRLILQCLPLDDGVDRLRREIMAAIPTLRVHVPQTAHVKIAHLRRTMAGDELVHFFAALQQISTYLVGKLTFHDVYTPLGRIPL